MDQETKERIIQSAPERMRESIRESLENGTVTLETIEETGTLYQTAIDEMGNAIKKIIDKHAKSVGFIGTFCTIMAACELIKESVREDQTDRQKRMFDMTIAMMVHRYKGNIANATLLADEIGEILNSKEPDE